MSYLWGNISRTDAEEKITSAGCEPGQFLVRSRGPDHPDDYVLCAAYKGKATHHLIVKDNGNYLINKKAYGDNPDVKDLINVLSKKIPGWPVVLNKPVNNPKAAGAAAKSGGVKKGASGKKKKGGKPKWMHGPISKEEATALLEEAGCEPGQFFVRSRAGKKNEYVLCVAYKGKPTHHLIGKNEDGIYAINKKTFGDFDKIKPLIMALSKPGVKGWPVQLTKPVNVKGSDEPAAKKAAPKKSEAAPKKAPAKKAPAKKAGSGKPSWLHGSLSKEEATEVMNKAGCEPNQFFLRTREGKKDEYVVCVVYKGKPTHHLMAKNPDTGIFMINKKSFGDFKTMPALVERLQKPAPGWPVPLTNPVSNGEEPAAEPEAPEPEPDAAVEEPKQAAAEPAATQAPAPDAAQDDGAVVGNRSGLHATVAPFDAASEFNGIAKNKASPDELPGSVEALMYANRYRDVLPNGHSRVKLQQIGPDALTTYINANHLRSWDGKADWYIAAQGPKPETIVDFWRMVWERNSEAVVMTTGITEGGRVKCAQYWPNEVSDAPHDYKDFKVQTISKKRVGQYIISELDLTYSDPKSTPQTRRIAHFWYDSWPDHGAPKATKPVTDMLTAVKARSAGGSAHPWVVHCSAGIGRTGTFIGVDMGMQQINTTGTTSVKDLIAAMRADRGGTVQTAVQAAFVKTALDKYAEQVNKDGVPKGVSTGAAAPETTIQRTLIRAVVGMAGKLGKYEIEINAMMAELEAMEKHAVNRAPTQA